MEKLKKRKIWICWKREPDGNGRMTKKPYSPLGFRTGTSLDHSNEWASYEEAEKAAMDYFDGIGFIIPDGYFFVDVDHQDAGSDFITELHRLLPSYYCRMMLYDLFSGIQGTLAKGHGCGFPQMLL